MGDRSSFDELVLPLRQPEPRRPGSTVGSRERSRTAIDPDAPSPESGFEIGGRPPAGTGVIETTIDAGR